MKKKDKIKFPRTMVKQKPKIQSTKKQYKRGREKDIDYEDNEDVK